MCYVAPPENGLPTFVITMSSNVMTESQEDVVPSCSPMYNNQLGSEARRQAALVDSLIGSQICVEQEPGDIMILSVPFSMQFNGNMVILF